MIFSRAMHRIARALQTLQTKLVAARPIAARPVAAHPVAAPRLRNHALHLKIAQHTLLSISPKSRTEKNSPKSCVMRCA